MPRTPKKHISPKNQLAPEPSATVVELAGVRRRLASLLYESLLVMGILAPTFVIPHVLLGMAVEVSAPGWVLWLHLVAVLGGYFVWYWFKHGHTLAMQTWRLKLVDSDGKPLALRQAVLRFILAWPSLLCFGVGYLWAFFDPERQFLHDRFAGTRVVLLPPAKKEENT